VPLARAPRRILQVFFYIDPAFLKDPAMRQVQSLTLSYTFFRTGELEVLDIENEYQKRVASSAAARAHMQQGAGAGTAAGQPPGVADAAAAAVAAAAGSSTSAAVRKWTEEVAARTGVPVPPAVAIAAAAGPSAGSPARG